MSSNESIVKKIAVTGVWFAISIYVILALDSEAGGS